MIEQNIIKLASKLDNFGLNNSFTHYSSARNKNCGDSIMLQLLVANKKIKSMKYETNSCVFCAASASLLSDVIKNSNVIDFKKSFSNIERSKDNNNLVLPIKYNSFKELIKNKYANRIGCVILPFKAVLKALKEKK
jgi:nitrogen fixation NifU-like protein